MPIMTKGEVPERRPGLPLEAVIVWVAPVVVACEILVTYLSLMFCYGLGNMANDCWTEQIFKRRWTTWQIPNVLEPSLSSGWAIIVIAPACLTLTAGKRAHDNAAG